MNYICHPNKCGCLHVQCCWNQIGITIVEAIWKEQTEKVARAGLNLYTDFYWTLSYASANGLNIENLYNEDNESPRIFFIDHVINLAYNTRYSFQLGKVEQIKSLEMIPNVDLTKRYLRDYVKQKLTDELSIYLKLDLVDLILKYLFCRCKCRCGNIFCKSKYTLKIPYTPEEYKETIRINPYLIFDLEFLKLVAKKYYMDYTSSNYYYHIKHIFYNKTIKIKGLTTKIKDPNKIKVLKNCTDYKD